MAASRSRVWAAKGRPRGWKSIWKPNISALGAFARSGFIPDPGFSLLKKEEQTAPPAKGGAGWGPAIKLQRAFAGIPS
ncbi:hypothetical protein AERO9A_230084 [Aeromonas salmonicida]|nr:hypothetical protein AERO9A_230084 [Aeromonas salmonicida]